MRDIYRAVCWGLAILLFAAAQASAIELKRILLLHSFGRDYSPIAEMGNSLRAALIKHSKHPIDLYEASVFKAKFDQSDEAGLVSYLQDVFASRAPDLIVTLGFPAAQFIERHRQKLFAGVPLVVAHNKRRLSASWSTQDTVTVLLEVDPQTYVENILRLLPDTKTIAVVMGNSPLEQYWRTQGQQEFRRFEDRVNFMWLNELSLEQMKKRVAELPPNSAVLETVVLVDAAGVPHPANRSLAAIREAANAPVFSYSDFEFGLGIVGGRLNQWNAFGEQIAAVVLRICDGEPPDSIKVAPFVPGPPMYDWRELKRWGISEDRLPPGSEIRFRQLTAWQQHPAEVIMVVIAMVAQALLIAGLFVERHRRHLAEMESRNRLAELTYTNRRAAASEASASVAHEISQPLAAIVSNGSAAMRWLAGRKPNLDEARAALKQIVSDGHRAADVIESLRGMYRREEPKKVLLDINTEIRHVLSFLRYDLKRNAISLKSRLTDGIPQVWGDSTQLKQVILNLVMNAVEAMSQISDRDRILELRTEADKAGRVIVTVRDTGPGIAPENLDRIFETFFTMKPRGMGMGLSICRSIAEAHGGRLTASPGASHGLIFTLILPTTEDGET